MLRTPKSSKTPVLAGFMIETPSTPLFRSTTAIITNTTMFIANSSIEKKLSPPAFSLVRILNRGTDSLPHKGHVRAEGSTSPRHA
jgi:hypothetical protein